MPTTDPRIDTYIAKSAPFAQPVLTHIRKLVHEACPEVEETLKWGFPHFDYKGVMISMASFKAHCSLNLWKGSLIKDLPQVSEGKSAMGNFGRITALSDLPPDDQLLAWFQEAKRLNEENSKLPQKPKERTKKELIVPDYLISALNNNQKAQLTWYNFSFSHRKEYVDWITEAKTEETRKKRLATALEWIAEGKKHTWRYSK